MWKRSENKLRTTVQGMRFMKISPVTSDCKIEAPLPVIQCHCTSWPTQTVHTDHQHLHTFYQPRVTHLTIQGSQGIAKSRGEPKVLHTCQGWTQLFFGHVSSPTQPEQTLMSIWPWISHSLSTGGTWDLCTAQELQLLHCSCSCFDVHRRHVTLVTFK